MDHGSLHIPARINILGEHVDYVTYLPTSSLTFGSDRHRMTMRFVSRPDREVGGESRHESFTPFRFSLDSLPGSGAWRDFIATQDARVPDWSNYVRGAVAFAQLKYGSSIDRGFDFIVDSKIPSAGGASSSSALTVLAGAAIRLVNAIEIDLEELARDSAQAEWYAGTRGGDMDHLTICVAQEGHAVHINYSDSSWRRISLPSEETRWVTAFSHPANKGAEVMLAYNERSAVSRILIPALLTSVRGIEELPESIDLDTFARKFPDAMTECRNLFPLLCERSAALIRVRNLAIHHRSETDRVARAAKALASVQTDSERVWRLLGELIDESHRSLRDNYTVSTAEVEGLREFVLTAPGVYGARLMGGGFGGNVLALVASTAVEDLVKRLRTDYYGRQGRDADAEGAITISKPGRGLMLPWMEME